MRLIFATNNSNKALEIQQLIGNNYTIQTLKDIGCTEDIEETGLTLTENASIKSHYVANHFHVNCFADDTGLVVDALNGEPGVHSARYAGTQRNDNDNMQLLLQKLAGKENNRNARFVTVISLMLNGIEYFFEGELNGTIITEKRGTNGFGYDPVFMPEGYNCTLAELSLAEKNTISHRAKAFNKLREFLTNEKI